MNVFAFLILVCSGKRLVRDDKSNESESARLPDSKEDLQVTISGNTDITIPEHIELTAQVLNYSNESSIAYRWEEPPIFKDSTSQIAKNQSTLVVPNPPAGSYSIKVIATDANGKMNSGEAAIMVNITSMSTVEPSSQTIPNSPPVAKVEPEIGVTIVSSKIIFSATPSFDPDDTYETNEEDPEATGDLIKSDIVNYKWEIKNDEWSNWVEEPVNTEDNFLELKPVNPGNITLILTVTDSAGASDSTEAQLSIKDDIDDPPTANAGDAIEIYLPTDHATLCGNSSSDDKGIVEWNWKAVASNPKQTGMNGVNKKCLTVSEIEVPGMYWYVLKVCDKKGQCDESKAQISVNKKENLPPVAVISVPTISNSSVEPVYFIPNNGQKIPLELDGCSSTDENDDKLNYKFWNEKTLAGLMIIQNDPTDCKATVEHITEEGEYVFELTVTDFGTPRLTDSSSITVHVMSALPPTIDFASVQTTYSSKNYISIDASKSLSYDKSNLIYSWVPTANSSATFSIINQSSSKNILELIDFEAGHYTFNLTVTDGQGQSSWKLSNIFVLESDELDAIFEMRISACQSDIRYFDEENIIDELLVTLKPVGVTNVHIRKIYHDHATQDVIIHGEAYGRSSGDVGSLVIVPLSTVLPVLEESFGNSGFKSFCKSSIPLIKSYICPYECNGHGTCNNGTNTCQCDLFWMSSPFISTTNCAWSVLYFTLSMSVFLFLGIISFFYARSIRQRKTKKLQKWKSRKNRKYQQIEQSSEEEGNSKRNSFPFRKRRKKKTKEEYKPLKEETSEEDQSEETLFDLHHMATRINEQRL